MTTTFDDESEVWDEDKLAQLIISTDNEDKASKRHDEVIPSQHNGSSSDLSDRHGSNGVAPAAHTQHPLLARPAASISASASAYANQSTPHQDDHNADYTRRVDRYQIDIRCKLSSSTTDVAATTTTTTTAATTATAAFVIWQSVVDKQRVFSCSVSSSAVTVYDRRTTVVTAIQCCNDAVQFGDVWNVCATGSRDVR